MFVREFNKAKNNIINLLIREKEIDNVKHDYIKSIKKEDIDGALSIKTLVKKESIQLDIKKSKLIEFEYTKLLLQKYLTAKYPNLSDIERKLALSMALKNIFKIKSMPDKSLELKEAILEYAKQIKTGLHYFSLTDCLNSKLKYAFGEDWDDIVEAFQSHDKIIQTNPTAIGDLRRAQKIIVESSLKDLATYDDISDYIVRTQLVSEPPLRDDITISELIHKYDILFLKNNGVNQISGLSKIYTLRDTIAAINDDTKDEENKYKYIAEYNNLVKAFNKLPRTKKR